MRAWVSLACATRRWPEPWPGRWREESGPVETMRRPSLSRHPPSGGPASLRAVGALTPCAAAACGTLRPRWVISRTVSNQASSCGITMAVHSAEFLESTGGLAISSLSSSVRDTNNLWAFTANLDISRYCHCVAERHFREAFEGIGGLVSTRGGHRPTQTARSPYGDGLSFGFGCGGRI